MIWLQQHPDVRIITDIKTNDNVNILAEIANSYPEAIQQFIPQIYSFVEYEPILELGYQDVILTLYRLDSPSSRY